nr:glycosyltransferase family 39 protein [Calditrichia bacterium]
GLGILNKYTLFFWGAGVLVGLILTINRRALLTPWPWLGGLVALLVASPNLIWQHQHDWPVFAHAAELISTQLNHGSPFNFIIEQFLMPLPTSAPFLLGGLWFFFVREGGKPFRLFGWMYFTILAMMLYLNAKAYYLAPMFPVLFAGGAVFTERLIRQHLLFWLKPVLIATILVPAVILLPYGLPVLPVNLLTDYCQVMARYPGLDGPLRDNQGELGLIPMDYADMLGWEERVDSVRAVVDSLPPEVRVQTTIFTDNYGQAGAIRVFGGKDFPPAYTFGSSYRYWPPAPDSAKAIITVGFHLDDLRPYFGKIRLKGFLDNPLWVREEQKVAIYLCTKPNHTPLELWKTATGN